MASASRLRATGWFGCSRPSSRPRQSDLSVLIALTARTIGATLVTADAGDFEAIRALRRFTLQVVPAAA